MNSVSVFYAPMDQAIFFELFKRNGLEPDERQKQQLLHYAKLLIEWNQKVNLISRKDEENVLSRHILHSLTLAMPQTMTEALPANSLILDIGTGGGLPGIPLAIVRPDIQFRLVDSIQKKINAVNDMIEGLGLTNAQGLAGRAEEMLKQKKLSANFDGVVSRAVAPLDELVGLTKNLLKPSAFLYSLKGGDLSEEIKRTKRMNVVQDVAAWPIELNDYDEFATEDKQIVKVTFR